MNYKISEISKLLGITTMTVRRYEEKGYISPIRNESDYRNYGSQDILRIAEIRLLRKCGFSHEEIAGLMNNSQETITKSFENHLTQLDEQINHLRFLRHWLKDNLEMLDRALQIGDSFIFFDNPPMYYVTYSIGNTLLKGRDRLNTINSFMYNAEEVQLIRIYKLDDYRKERYIPHACWAIKEMDVERLHLEDLIYDNPCVEYYPGQHCVYSTISIPESDLKTPDLLQAYPGKFRGRLDSFLKENRLLPAGDTVVFMTDILGSTSTFLVCIPVADE